MSQFTHGHALIIGMGADLPNTIQDAAGANVGSYSTPVYTSKADSRYSKILLSENGGQSWYNGLALQLRKRMSHGISGSIAYTWAHAIDYKQGTYQGKPDEKAWAGAPWNGNQKDWELAINNRNQSQNEYKRIR